MRALARSATRLGSAAACVLWSHRPSDIDATTTGKRRRRIFSPSVCRRGSVCTLYIVYVFAVSVFIPVYPRENVLRPTTTSSQHTHMHAHIAYLERCSRLLGVYAIRIYIYNRPSVDRVGRRAGREPVCPAPLRSVSVRVRFIYLSGVRVRVRAFQQHNANTPTPQTRSRMCGPHITAHCARSARTECAENKQHTHTHEREREQCAPPKSRNE